MSLLFDVWLIMHSMTTLVDDALDSSELSGDDFGLYSLLRRFGPATPTQIARWTGMKPTTVSFAIKRLTQRRHATQMPHPSDGRSYLVGLNDTGVAAHRSAARLFLGAMEKLSAELGPDDRDERAALQRVDAAFRAVLALDARPYDLGADHAASTWTLSYDGPALSPEHEGQVRNYIAFLQSSNHPAAPSR
jgi:DNA-binding MarR family transcriptional regulator